MLRGREIKWNRKATDCGLHGRLPPSPLRSGWPWTVAPQGPAAQYPGQGCPPSSSEGGHGPLWLDQGQLPGG